MPKVRAGKGRLGVAYLRLLCVTGGRAELHWWMPVVPTPTWATPPLLQGNGKARQGDAKNPASTSSTWAVVGNLISSAIHLARVGRLHAGSGILGNFLYRVLDEKNVCHHSRMPPQGS